MTTPENHGRMTFPHCDDRVLHAPGECAYCDKYPEYQQVRTMAGFAFTGHDPEPGQLPCPADQDRPAGSASDHRRWGGNKPTSATGDPTWPAETAASVLLYGDLGGRAPWPSRARARVRRRFRDLLIRRAFR